MPGDPTTLLIGPNMTMEERMILLNDYGLDKPFILQYFLYLKELIQGNLGISFIHREPVLKIIMGRLPWTLLLMGVTQLVTASVGIPLGVIAARKKGSNVDQLINTFTIFGISIFIPWLGVTLLYFFGYINHFFPIGGAYMPWNEGAGLIFIKDVIHHMILPVLTLSVIYLANYVLYMRSSMIDILSEDYIRTARAKGLKERKVVWKHGVKNGLIPTVTMAGLLLGRMVGGAVLTETVYSYPGVGRMIYEAVGKQDFPVLQGAFIILAFSVILMNIITDLIYAYLDPRIKVG